MPESRIQADAIAAFLGLERRVRDPDEERVLRASVRYQRSLPHESDEARETALAALYGGAPDPGLDDLDDVANAQEFVYRAWEASDRHEARALVDEALKLDPANVDALVWRCFDRAETADDVRRGLERAAAVGRDALGEAFFREHRGFTWARAEARPYLYTRYLLARELAGRGREREALAHHLDLLELDEPDSLGVRFAAIGLALRIDDRELASTIFERYPADDGAHGLWSRLLATLVGLPDDDSDVLLGWAREANPFVEGRILHSTPSGWLSPEACEPGSVEEAKAVAFELQPAFARHPQALAWLSAHGERWSESALAEATRRLEARTGRPAPPWLPKVLAETGKRPAELTEEVAGDGEEAIPWLLALVEDDALEGTEDPDFPHAPEWATGLLMALGRTDVAPRLAARLLDLEAKDRGACLLARVIVNALTAFGPAAVDALLSHLEHPPLDAGIPPAAALIALAQAGEGDDRAYRRLLDELDVSAAGGARLLAAHGDPQAIGPIRAALAKLPPFDDDTLIGASTVVECLNAIEWLGGALTPAERSRRLKANETISGIRRRSFLDFDDDDDDDDFDDDEDPELDDDQSADDVPPTPWFMS